MRLIHVCVVSVSVGVGVGVCECVYIDTSMHTNLQIYMIRARYREHM